VRHLADSQKKLIWTKEEYETEAETRILSTGRVLKGIEYNSSTKGEYPNGKEIVSIGSTENCESEKWDTEVEKDKKYLSTM